MTDPELGAKPPRGHQDPDREHAAAIPLDTAATRGAHLRKILADPRFLSVSVTTLIVAFGLAAHSTGSVGFGAAAAGAVILGTLLIAFAIATNRAAEDFFTTYCARRGLVRDPSGNVPGITPLLRRGDRRSAEHLMRGVLPGGLDGMMAHYTYEIRTRSSDGDIDTERYPFTVAIAECGQRAATLVTDIICQPRSGLRALDSLEDKFRKLARLELESEAFDRRYEVFFGPNDPTTENWMKQLFVPSFIVWMSERPPQHFGFELSAGALCAYSKGHRNEALELDEFAKAASGVADRIRQEASEADSVTL